MSSQRGVRTYPPRLASASSWIVSAGSRAQEGGWGREGEAAVPKIWYSQEREWKQNAHASHSSKFKKFRVEFIAFPPRAGLYNAALFRDLHQAHGGPQAIDLRGDSGRFSKVPERGVA